MPSNTPKYGLGYFDFGDPLGIDYSGQVEVDRWLLVDKQLYGLMSVIGDGVIDGWIVTQSEDFAITISEGYGNIDSFACRSVVPSTLTNLPANTLIYVYARNIESSRYDQSVDFFYSPTPVEVESVALLATVDIGPQSITAIDNSVRDEIDFLDLIKDVVKTHKHRGGSLNPSKINLSSEVQGQLPSFRIADFDAEKISTGTIDAARMPVLDHSDLENSGLLSHPGLDSFVQALEANNKELFGEVGTSAMLQMLLAMKYIYDDPNSPYFNSSRRVDQYMVNEIALIPGITPDSMIDFDNSTAVINLVDHQIEGVPATSGSSFYVTYDTNLAWRSAYYRNRVSIANDSVALAYNDADETTLLTIESFESASEANQQLSGSGGLFRSETVVLTDNAQILSTNTQSTEGYWAGRFSHSQSFRSQFVKEFSVPQDWSSYDAFVLDIKCIDQIHGVVKIYFVSGSGELSPEYILLDTDEVTSDSTQNNFETRVISLPDVGFSESIKSMIIYTDDLVNPFSFVLDHIHLRKAILLPEQGSLKIRYNSSVSVTFSQIEWVSDEPVGTGILIRARSASSEALLNRSEFSPYLFSGSLINLTGTDIEIEITLTPDTTRTISPVLSSLRLLVLSPATDNDGLSIDSLSEFSRGAASNVIVNDSPVSLTLQSPVYVGSYYFLVDNVGNQIHDNGTYTQAELPIFGSRTPIAPNQVFRRVEEQLGAVTSGNLALPRSISRTVERTFVIADTYNDRVLELDESGELVSGIGSINYQHNSKLFPVAACVDVRSGILYVVWSRPVNYSAIDISKMTIQTSTQKVRLTRNSDKINNQTTEQLSSSNYSGQITPIYLSVNNASVVSEFSATNTYLSVSYDVVSGDIDADSEFYKRIKTALGIPVFVGNFVYLSGIFCPTSAQKTENGNFVIANGKLGVKDFKFGDGFSEELAPSGTVPSIVEFNSNYEIVFSSNIMSFSPFVPGRVERMDDNTLLVGGIRPNGKDKKDNLNFRSVSGDKATKLQQKTVLQEVFFSGSPKCTGAVVVYDTRDNSTLFEYISPEGLLVSDVDIDPRTGEYIVAESSFLNSGRVIKLDSSANIVFSMGEGSYGIINDVSVKYDGSIVVST